MTGSERPSFASDAVPVGEFEPHEHTDECREYGCIKYAERLYEAGVERARQRAAKVQDLRIERTDPLVLAVLERWGIEPVDAAEGFVVLAVSAVQVPGCEVVGPHEHASGVTATTHLPSDGGTDLDWWENRGGPE